MYASFFGLRGLPFNNTPDPRFFYSTPDHEEALASLVYAIKERKGFVLLTGEVGAGKTLVSRMALRHFGAHIAFANVNHVVQDGADLMRSLCTEFDLDAPRGASNTRFVRILQDYLLSQFAHNTPVVLMLDEAQNFPTSAFEQLRMAGNLEADDANLLQIVIVGQPELQRMFASPKLRQLRQRIFRSFHLPALNREATGGYIRHRLAIVGGGDMHIFDENAVDRIYEISQGLPRLINTVCDNAMLGAYSADQRAIDGPFIDSVAEQMMIVDGSHETEWDFVEGEAEKGTHQVATHAVAPAGQLPAVKGQSGGTPSLLIQARAAHGSLKPLVERAKAATAHVQAAIAGAEAASRAMEKREAQIRQLAGKIKAVIGEVRRLHDGLNRGITRTGQPQDSAKAALDRLTAQTQQWRQLADTMTRMHDRTAPRSGLGNAHPSVTHEAFTAVSVGRD